MNNLPSFYSYGDYTSGNYGAHCLCFIMGGIDVYFSYKTPVAFRHKGKLIVRENDWGPTTGKHLNWIDGGDKASRIDGEQFEQCLCDVMKKLS